MSKAKKAVKKSSVKIASKKGLSKRPIKSLKTNVKPVKKIATKITPKAKKAGKLNAIKKTAVKLKSTTVKKAQKSKPVKNVKKTPKKFTKKLPVFKAITPIEKPKKLNKLATKSASVKKEKVKEVKIKASPENTPETISEV